MSTNDRTILLVLPLVAALVAFWFLAISPKRDEVSKLDEQITGLEASVQQQEAAAQAGLEARKSFRRDYQRLVVLGKAVPVDDETASLLVQLNEISRSSGVDFRAIKLSEGSSGGTAATPTAPATEGAASLLPIGATVGAAGLPIMPYELTFRGTYFEVADFMAGVDQMVKTRKGTIAADGRLVTIDSFSYTADDAAPYPVLRAVLNITTYVSPADQGLTGGATPAGPSTVTTPAPAAPATTTSSTTPAAP